jgi:hypothetical protein
MISSEVQRTLVKSPPELWSELSDPAALARHLGELGEIRITRVEPERKVEWEAENTTGTVAIKPSGWGTRVTLTVNRELPDPTPEPEPDAEPEPQAELEPEAEPTTEAEPEPMAESELAPDWEPVEALEPAREPEAASRRGFFARLFGRRRSAQAVELDPLETVAAAERPREPAETMAVDDAIAGEDTVAVYEPEMGPASVEDDIEAPRPGQAELAAEVDGEPGAAEAQIQDAERARDISAELKAAEEIAEEEVAAVLTSVLDRLGAAHHRPFSRA